MLKVIDLQISNIGSITKALNKLGVAHEVIDSPEALADASKIILPGVGSFDVAANNLEQSGFKNSLKEAVTDQKVPILGICLGMQLLAKNGSEGGRTSEGLALINAEINRIETTDTALRVPHMGWNDIQFDDQQLIFTNIPKHSCFYFVHSYHMQCLDTNVSVATTDYGQAITAYVNLDHIHGAQFHPEKSQEAGLTLLSNFVKLC